MRKRIQNRSYRWVSFICSLDTNKGKMPIIPNQTASCRESVAQFSDSQIKSHNPLHTEGLFTKRGGELPSPMTEDRQRDRRKCFGFFKGKKLSQNMCRVHCPIFAYGWNEAADLKSIVTLLSMHKKSSWAQD